MEILLARPIAGAVTAESSAAALRSERAAIVALSPAEREKEQGAMSGHFAAKYPENGLHRRVVEAIVVEGGRLLVKRGADAPVRVLNQAASQGTFGPLIQTAWAAASAVEGALPLLSLHQCDLIEYAPGGVCGVDAANWPLDAAGARLDAGSVDVAIAGCCWYNGQAPFNLVANGVVAIARQGALMLFGATRRQFVSLAPSLQAFVLSGMVHIEIIENVKLNPAHAEPDAFFIRSRKQEQTAPLLEGSALHEAIFVGQLRSAGLVEEARLGASLALRGRIQAVLDLHGPLLQAVKLGLVREAAMLLRGDAIGVSARDEVALGLAAAASLLIPHAPALASVFKPLEPLIAATGASAHFCMLASGAREGFVAAMTGLAVERRAALEPLDGIDAIVAALEAAGRGGGILPAATLSDIIEACSISPGARPVLAAGVDTHALGHQGVYGIPGTVDHPEWQRVGIGLGCAVERMRESDNHMHGALLVLLPHELAGKGGGGAVADSSDNYVKTFAAQAVEVATTKLYMGGLSFRQMWGNPNTVHNSIDLAAWGGAATGLLRAAAAAELHAMRADGRGAEVDARLDISSALRGQMRAAANTAIEGGAGGGAVRRATTWAFRELPAPVQTAMRISDSKDGG